MNKHDKKALKATKASKIYGDFGIKYYTEGEFAKSLKKWDLARKLLQKNNLNGNLTIEIAKVDFNTGMVFYRLSLYEKALERYEAARTIFVDNNLTLDVAESDQNIGLLFYKVGEFEMSLKKLESARIYFEQNNMPIKVAEIDHGIGLVFYKIGRFDEAIERYELSREIGKAKYLFSVVAENDHAMAVAFYSLGRLEMSLKKLESARIYFEQNNMPIKVAEIDHSMGNILVMRGRVDEALQKYEAAQKIFEKKGLSFKALALNANIGLIFHKKGEFYAAIDKYESTRKIFNEKNLTHRIAEIDHNMGLVFASCGCYEEALVIFNNSLDSLAKANVFSHKSNVLHAIGFIYLKMNNIDQAYTNFKQAIEAVREQKTFFRKDDIKTDFLGTILNIYESMIALCLKQGKFEEALEYTEEIKSQNLVEKLAQKSLKPSDNTPEELTEEFERLRRKLIGISLQFGNNDNPERTERLSKEIPIVEKKLDEILSHIREHDPEFDPFFKKRIKMEEITALIPDDATAIIEIFPFKDKTAVFVVRKDKPVQETTIINEKYGLEQLNPAVEEFIKYYEAKSPDWILIMNTLLARLYKEIFVEAKKHLDGIERIIFIPYGVLHRVPLHAMYYSEDLNGQKHYLIDDYIISFAPSASILKSSIDKARHKSDTGSMKIATANPEHDLEKIYVEAEAIQRLYPNNEYQRDVNINNFSKLAQQAEILHYAGHGDSESLALQDGKLKMEDVFADYRMPMCRLMVMSACETGITQLGATDEHIGISSAFLYAGASTVVSSLWTVRDDTTSLLMRKMYENIQEGLSTADALRQAQLWLKDNNKKNEHETMLYKAYANHDCNVSSLPHQPSSNLLHSSTSVNRAPRETVNETQPSLTCPDYDSIYYWAGFISSGNFSI